MPLIPGLPGTRSLMSASKSDTNRLVSYLDALLICQPDTYPKVYLMVKAQGRQFRRFRRVLCRRKFSDTMMTIAQLVTPQLRPRSNTSYAPMLLIWSVGFNTASLKASIRVPKILVLFTSIWFSSLDGICCRLSLH